MKRNLWVVPILLLSCVLVASCEHLNIAPNEQACEIIYGSGEDSTETLRQILINNKSLERVKNEH